MDTPDKKQVTVASLSKFEDSPVFNYINNLSPLEQIKSVHSDHSFNLVTFASPSSFFASPKISSLRESRVLFKSNLSPDTLTPELLSHGNKDKTSKGNSEAVQLSNHSAEQLGNLTPGNSKGEVIAEPLDETLRLATETPKSMKYDGWTPVSNKVSCAVKGTSRGLATAGETSSLVHSNKNDLIETNNFEDKSNLRKICRIERSKEIAGCDWVSLVSEAVLNSNLSIVESDSEKQDQQTVDAGAISFISTVIQLPQENANDVATPSCSCKQNEMTEPVTHPEEIGDMKDMYQSPDILSSTLLNKLVVSDSRTKVDNEEEECDQSGCKQHNIRRRCLVFEMAGAHKKPAAGETSCMLSVPSQSDCKNAYAEKHMVQRKTENICSSSMLAGVGLHLNALATGSKNCKVVKCETLASGRKVISMRSSISSSLSLASCQSLLKKSSTLNSKERDSVPCANEFKAEENAMQTSVNVNCEEFDNSSPKRKRHVFLLLFFWTFDWKFFCLQYKNKGSLIVRYKPEHNDESKVCKRCNCKRSKCLKLYCECFAAGVYCIEPCSCLDCFNKPIYEDKVLETRRQIEFRNPLAFAPKVIRSTDSIAELMDETNKTPASARHKKGCNCRRSSCLKKYCECFQGGVGCSISCRCEGCKNSFGRKDGAGETEYEGYESEACEKNELETNLKDNTAKEHPELLLPSSDIPRAKRSGSSLLPVGPSPKLSISLETSSFFNQPKFEKHLQLTPEYNTSKILKSSFSQTIVIPASPNSKRDSPPRNEIESSTPRFARRLTLRSSLSFPSMTSPREL